MLYNLKRKQLCRHLLAGGVVCLAGLAAFSCSDTYDLESEQPSGLNTIYGYMSDKGNFRTFLQLIDDLEATESTKTTLSRTGSKTLFIANDDAFAKFFQQNGWGVSSYSELSMAQKKMLLHAAMVDNPYSASMLSTGDGPVRGEVCRRPSSLSLFDSVEVLSTTSEEIPQDNPRWTSLKDNHSEIVLFKDATASPLIHFTPKFLESHKLLSSDVDFLYNNASGTRQADETYVNHSRVLSSQFCKNGFVHEVSEVITPLDNMAETIRKSPELSIYSGILERFSALKAITPNANDSLASYRTDYNRIYGKDIDTLFIKRYYSYRTAGSGNTQSRRLGFTADKDGLGFDALLNYDPGWNTFNAEVTAKTNHPEMEDMAVMVVPTDEAFNEWWNNGDGAVLKAFYGTVENTPTSVLSKLLNVSMIESMTAALPSNNFNGIKNEAQVSMGVTTDYVDNVKLACNGAIYVTNKVFAPASYSSVLFPTVVDTENLNIINNAIGELQNDKSLQYDAYLNSMVSTYSFFIPTNQGMLTYVDPVSYALGEGKTRLWEFHYDEKKTAPEQRIYANVYECILNDDGTWTKGEQLNSGKPVEGGVTNDQIANRMRDLLDNIIVTEPIQEGKHYYVTKGKNYVYVDGTINTPGAMRVSGSWQVERNQPLTVNQVYKMENGYAYVVDGPLMGTRKATSDIVAERPELSEFYELLAASGAISETSIESTTDNFVAASRNQDLSLRGNLVTLATVDNKARVYSLLNAYHYTVYAPTNEAMQAAYKAGLPTMEEYNAALAYDEAHLDENTDSASHITEIWRDFIKYHVQNNSIYMDEGFTAGNYETTKSNLQYEYDENGQRIPVDANGKVITGTLPDTYYWQCTARSPYRIRVKSVGAGGITIEDVMGNEAHVVKTTNLYNLMGREYWLGANSTTGTSQPTSANAIVNSSSVVVHAIDRPLYYDYNPSKPDAENQFHYIPRKIIDEKNVKRRK